MLNRIQNRRTRLTGLFSHRPLAQIRLLPLLALAFTCASFIPATLSAQEPAAEKPRRLRVFLDGEYMRIGSDFIRTEMDFVDWVRDQADSDVHIIVTSQSAGGGGTAYTIDFLGRRSFTEKEDSLVYTSGQGDTDDETRTGVVRTMKLGLGPFLARTLEGANFDLSYRAARRAEASEVPEVDPWDYWVFRTSLSGNLSGETSRKDKSVNGSFSARRITEALKLEFSLSGDYRENWISLSSGARTDYSHTLGHDGLVAFSLGQHWAAGLRTSVDSSTRLNQRLTTRFSPVIEYSFFPYREFTRRQLTLQYSIGWNYFNYEDMTLFGYIDERRYDESLRISFDVTQPWGDANISTEVAHYFFDPGKFHISVNSRCDIRLFRGFSF
ncbi:hypothetical protein ACFL4Y_04180, partial [Gemmatimonadota bacterium]